MDSTGQHPRLPFDRPTILEAPPLWARLRAERPVAPVRTVAGDQAWMVLGYEEAKALFADDRLGRSHPDPARAARISDAALMSGPVGSPETEREQHARMRRLLTPAFSARRMKAMAAHVQALVDELLDRMSRLAPPVDLHEQLSFPLPVLVICELLGVPYEDRDRFRVWSDDVANLHDRERATAALAALHGYMLELIERRRREPREDVISDLVAVEREGTGLTEQAMAGLATGLLFAGHETTVSRIDFGTLLLLANPDQREALRRDPSLAPGAVEEILRVSVPGGGAGLLRYARADIEIAGARIRAGDAVLLSSGAANRDLREFAEADRFDIRRQPNQHLAFGHGQHFCLGAALARVELQAVFGTLFQRFPALALAVPLEDLQLREDLLVGGLRALPVTW